ncbi:maleate cis-trans isomerase family protein [Acuticoccus sediminis]|uniref:maleate cis-trans isomerase family protein n=1 Tax=Acuticoccus sediminis TaxID=2184697 RepID=UPI001B3BA860|nr:aspartate/glutamate racemase family protein [Acuticoccus sediminis]
MTVFPFSVGPPLGDRANLGLVVLRTDETIESDFRRLVAEPGVAVYTARIPCETEVTPEALARMKAALPAAAALLPWSMTYDVVAYACTSASTVIGSDAVAAAVREGVGTRHVTDPLAAVKAACDALGVRRLGFLSPYVAPVSASMRAALEAYGLRVAAFGTFAEESDERIARIEGASIVAAVERIAAEAPCDAIFASCTNLRAAAEIEGLEARLGVPVLASNQALAWHMMQLAGVPTGHIRGGCLMRCALPPEAPRDAGH